MRHTLTSLNQLCIDGSGGDSESASQTFYKRRLNQKYEFVLNKLPTYLAETVRTFNTVADQQYYHYPPTIKEIESLEITVGNVKYPLLPIFSNHEWVRLNSLTFQGGAVPVYYYKRQRDFGIFPIPSSANAGTIEYTLRAAGMVRGDYTTGSVTVTENDATLEGAGGTAWSTKTNIDIDDWFSLTDSNGESRGDWYRVSSITDDDTLEFTSVFEEPTESGATYLIGQSPELPEDMHELLAYGALADYFGMKRQSQVKAQGYSNMFWTGEWTNASRREENASGGLLNAIKMYRDRDTSQLILRKKTTGDARLKVFATTLS